MIVPEDPKPEGPEGREFPRFPSRIPAQVEIAHAWQGTSAAPLGGELYNISRGGAGLRLDRVLPPRTRLRIGVPSVAPGSRLSAEVVWTSAPPGSGRGPAVYGVRWLEQLSRSSLESIVPGQVQGQEREGGLAPTTEP